MSTHNICFCGEIRKILCGYPLLSVAMAPSKDFFQPKSVEIVLIVETFLIVEVFLTVETFLFLYKNTCYWYSIEVSCRGASNVCLC